MRYKNDVIFQSMDPKEAAEFTKGDPEKIKLMREIKAQQKIEDFKAPIKQDDPMTTWVKNTTALNKNPGAFKKEVKASESKQLELPLDIPKIDFNLLKSPVAPDAGSIKQEPVTKETRIEDDPKYRNTIFGTDVLYRRKRGLDD